MSISNDSKYNDPDVLKALEEMILEILEKKNLSETLIDGSFMIDLNKESIAELFKSICDNPIPDQVKDKYVKSRQHRTLASELNRLAYEACTIYKDHFIPKIPEPIIQLISQGDSDRLNHFVEEFFYKVFLVLLNEEKTPGDDIVLFIRYVMELAHEKTVNDIMADRLSGPAYSMEAVYGICGLIIQAGRAQNKGLIDEAFGYLIDASNMLGMYKSAEFMRSRFESVANSYFAKKNANKKHLSQSALNSAKQRVRELFFSLRGAVDEKSPQPIKLWKSASAAHEKIAQAMSQEIHDKVIGDSTIHTLCKQLHKREKEAAKRRTRPKITVIVKQTLDDGTVVPIQLI